MNTININPLYSAILLFLVFFTILFVAMIMIDVNYPSTVPTSNQ